MYLFLFVCVLGIFQLKINKNIYHHNHHLHFTQIISMKNHPNKYIYLTINSIQQKTPIKITYQQPITTSNKIINNIYIYNHKYPLFFIEAIRIHYVDLYIIYIIQQSQCYFTGQYIELQVLNQPTMQTKTNQKPHNSTFLKKLQQMLSNPTLHQTIRWNPKGTTINVTCIKRLQEQVLPLYFRHSKYTSFVRQLNIYGFSKCKSEKGVAASFGHPIYVRGFQEFGRIVKRGRKEEGRRGKGKGEGTGGVGNDGKMYHMENNTGQLVSADNNKNQSVMMEQQHITQKYSQIYKFQQKQSTQQPLPHRPLSYLQSPNQQPSVTELIEQLDAKIQEFPYDLDILKTIEIESLLKDNRYTMIRPFYQDRRNYQIQNYSQNSSLEEIDLAMWEYHEGRFQGILNSQRMEFIL